MQQLVIAVRALIYASGFVWLWWWGALEVRAFDARLGLVLPRWLVPVGILLTVAGALLALSCLFVFVHFGRGTAAPFDPPRRFVAVGPYRFVRNPMYIGGFMVILGAGFILLSTSIAAWAGVFFGVMHLFVILYEEPSLERRFGASYRDYQRRVRRWLPAFGVNNERGAR
jgi:protein-S-isoprenylcysteine O-methyltransferase Ste14